MVEPQEVPTRILNSQTARSRDRARELYKYFTPQTLRPDVDRGDTSSPDSILVSQAQLVTWKLDARRCLINFLDRDTQYCVADGTKTVHLDNLGRTDDPADCLASLYAPSVAEHSICHYTMNAKRLAPREDSYPCFEVLNLREDPRFVSVPEKAGSPAMTYYCGTPLRTKKGISIGALCVFDDKPRAPMSKEDLCFLDVIAQNIISHLELLRDKSERQRANKMSSYLNIFVDPDYQIQDRRRGAPDSGSWRGSNSNSASTPQRNPLSAPEPPSTVANMASLKVSNPRRASPGLKNASLHSSGYHYHSTRSGSDDAESKNSNSNELRVLEADHTNIYKFGAELLKDSLDLEDGGGVVFFDTVPALDGSSNAGFTKTTRDINEEQYGCKRGSYGHTKRDSGVAEERAPVSTNATPVEVLASAKTAGTEFSSFYVKPLTAMRKRYPRGKLWVFDSEGNLCDSEDERDDNSSRVTQTHGNKEAALIQHHFPGARQVIGLPLLDPRTSRWTHCFAWSTSAWRSFSYETDFLFAIVFCNCITVEKSRLATLAADQQKGDFIGSISHELRSPLHGILGSCEFLQDTEATTFQKSLVDTVDSCARTLLDTISMVLDYSKINSFDRNDRISRRDNGTPAKHGTFLLSDMEPSRALGPSLKIYDNVDLALITEQVIEGVQSGHLFRGASELLHPEHEDSMVTRQFLTQNDVEVVVDIAPGDWMFVTQPGAFRRIVMNIVGNALKYTEKGLVTIKLEKLDEENEAERGTVKSVNTADSHKLDSTVVRLTVSDTGKGITPEYLRTRLFEPFSQEDTLAPGTGLGLSLVKSILEMLHGYIDVRSTLNSGTTVTVTLPMERQTSEAHSGADGAAINGLFPDSESKRADMSGLAKQQKHQTVGIFFHGKESGTASYPIRTLLESVQTYMNQWYGLRNVSRWSGHSKVDMVIADESDLDALLETTSKQSPRPYLVVLCSNASRLAHWNKHSTTDKIEFISKPFGPYKLARALQAHLEQSSLCVSGGSFDVDDEVEVSSEANGVSTRPYEVTGMDELASPTTPVVDTPLEPLQASRPQLLSRRTISATGQELGHLEVETSATTTAMSHAGSAIDPKPVETTQAMPDLPTCGLQEPQPRLLLVDDNPINLKLLETYAKKCKYPHIATATNGLKAVQSFKSSLGDGKPPDIIFMDLSMPVMGGLEATKRIREIESNHGSDEDDEESDVLASQQEGREESRKTMIVALTGLASGKDQVEAFTAGVDLYMTKPIRFKELGKLLDNWKRTELGRIAIQRDED